VYPGFLVDDPEGYAATLQSELRVEDAKIDSLLYAGAEQFSTDPELSGALLEVAQVPDSRRALLLLAEILRAPGLADRLGEVLRPGISVKESEQPDDSRRGNGHPPPEAPN
jgi:hypothetical protein